jgi:hypothetical protein
MTGSEDACAALTCDAPEYDFGSRPDTELGFSHTFEVRNAGTETLVLTAVRSSCDCVTAEMAGQLLRPGECAPVDTHFAFGGETGPQLRAVHLAYRPENAPAAEPVQVFSMRLRGAILAPVMRLPNRLDLGAALPGSVVTGSVSLLSGRCGAFALGAIGFADSGARAEYAAGITSTQHLVRLLISVPPQTGPFSGLALVNTDLAEMPNVPIRFAGRSAPLFEIRPSALTVTQGQPLSARLKVSSPYGTAFRILSATSTDPCVSVKIVEDAAGAKLTVTAEARDEVFAGALVRLATDHPVCRVIEVPMRAAPRH